MMNIADHKKIIIEIKLNPMAKESIKNSPYLWRMLTFEFDIDLASLWPKYAPPPQF